MSYILEALKKAEQARLATTLPDIKSIALSAEKAVREPPAWFYGATLVAVVAGATGLGWWFAGKPHERTLLEKVAAASPTTGREAARDPVVKPFHRATELPVLGGPQRDSVTPAPSAVSSSAPVHAAAPLASVQPAESGQVDAGSQPRGAVEAADKVAGKPGSPGQKPAASPSGSANPVLDKKAAPGRADRPVAAATVEPSGLKPSPVSRVLRPDELPPEVRRDVPRITVSGYVYSTDAGGRVATINERSLREGDELIAGMKLEQIAQDHVLFSFRGYRFRVEMF